ncbi:phosphate acetyltransferase [Candidatus Peregrinibacteria bacterium]|nr:phosphate acetyltransferase [Candidatus Peregrinibacteria bacterium]
MKSFIRFVKNIAKKNPQRIVFPESSDDRVIMAVARILKEKTALPILLGNKDEIRNKAKILNLKIDYDKLTIIDHLTSEKRKEYARLYYDMRKDKGIDEKTALEKMKDPDYFGTMMVYTDEADAMITGATHPTNISIRPAFEIIKTKEKFHKVSGLFFLVLEKRLLLFADTAVVIDPSSDELADIAIDTAETAKRFHLEPRIAMLSFSTHGSASHPSVEKVKEATAMVKHRRPDLIIEGEMQVDAALVPDVCKRKFPDSKLTGNANILIFPDLNSGNIGYKLVERLAKAKAVGPILQGLKKVVNKLSRGCSWRDIVDLSAFTSCEAQETIYKHAKKFKA